MAEHADPEFYAKWEFCRTDCPECDRLDAEELAASGGKITSEQLGEAITKAVAALRAGEEMPNASVH